jgi:hypothetical protein
MPLAFNDTRPRDQEEGLPSAHVKIPDPNPVLHASAQALRRSYQFQ